VDISVSATQIKKIGTTATDSKSKLAWLQPLGTVRQRKGSEVWSLCKEIRRHTAGGVAFEMAGCPASLTGKELDAWIAYARELEGEDDSQGPPSFTEMRARIVIVGELLKAQASSLLRISHRAIS